MHTIIRIINYRCQKNHKTIAVYQRTDHNNPKCAEVCIYCESCGPSFRVIPWEEILDIEPVSEFRLQCSGVTLCIPNDPEKGFSVKIPADNAFTWVLRSNNTAAVLNWGKMAVYAISPYENGSPEEVKAAASALLLNGGANAR